MSEIHIGRLGDVAPGRPRLVEANGRRVALARVGDAVYALDDTCVHSGGPLSEGKQSGARLACPWHGWSYDVKTGACLLPAHAKDKRVATYSVRVDGDDLWLTVP
ncbi:MAG: Rieske 2Fe-2S domain-containing protein [Candidatus Rokubacteria bacterium]|nr:Rieske 2Fe-2S domain-containing protein [Candidatus Rokubacteria bacterium]